MYLRFLRHLLLLMLLYSFLSSCNQTLFDWLCNLQLIHCLYFLRLYQFLLSLRFLFLLLVRAVGLAGHGSSLGWRSPDHNAEHRTLAIAACSQGRPSSVSMRGFDHMGFGAWNSEAR